jgi:hypothetical protein
MDKEGYLSRAIFADTGFLNAYDAGIFWRGSLDKNILKKSFSWEHVNDALSAHRITNDRFRLSLKDAHIAPNKLVFRATKDTFGRPTDHLLINELHRQLRSGATGVFESIHEIFPEIETFIEALSARYYSRSAANAYISFGTTSGFGVHNDDHDVLVCQIEGKKRWNFFGSPSKEFKATVNDLKSPSELDITEKLILSEGDMLFIPKGTWHDVEAIGEPSLHLTISLVYPSIQNYLEWLLTQNKFDMPYRDIRLKNKDLLEIGGCCRSFFEAAVSEASLANFLKIYYSKYPSVRNRPCFPSLNTASLEDSYQKIPFSFVDISDGANSDDTYSIIALGKKYILSPRAYKLLSEMQVGECYSGGRLLDIFHEYFGTWASIVPAVQDLLNEGLIRKRKNDIISEGPAAE